ncbi:UNVERIFIED_CONTAM: hypothetical protein Sradi_7153600 [Sesamum radiatum]|uniref:Retroviral polymerase SH3-like domain-containing protein n=1 Tax=Sesamum radiatum TaxID=300843 RepID=A0AAW2IVY5_SESRA
MDTNKFNGTNYTDWLRNLRVVLDFENQGYVLDKPLPTALLEGSSCEQHLTFDKWLEDNRKVRSIILASMTNEIQKQYNRLDDVPSIMNRMKESHGVKMLSLVEMLEDLKAVLNNDTYTDVILQCLPPSYDPFIVNYNMNGLEKSIHELINMLVQYEVTTYKFEPAVSVGEATTSKVKDKGARSCKRKKGKGQAIAVTTSARGSPAAPTGKSKGKVGGSSSRRKMMCACIVMERGIGRESVHKSSPTQMLERSRRLSKDEMILRLGDGKAIAAEAVGSLSLVISNRIRIELKDCFYVPSNTYLKLRIKLAAKQTPFDRTEVLNGVAERRNRTLLDMVRCMMSSTELPPSFLGYALETAAKLLNIALSKTVPQTLYEIWHGKPASYKFIGYPKEIAGYYFYDLSKQKSFVSRNAVFFEKGFSLDNRRDEVLLKKSSEEPHHDSTASFEPLVHTDGVPVLRRSTRESRVPERYGFIGLTSQLDNYPKRYGEAMSDIDSDKWLEYMKFEMA